MKKKIFLSKINSINKQLKKLYVLLFKNYQFAFLDFTKREKQGDGFWVYYSSYAEFKKQQRKTKLIGYSTLLGLSALVIACLIINIVFPVIFRIEASTNLGVLSENQEDFVNGETINADVSDPTGEIRLLAKNEKMVLINKNDFAGSYTPDNEALYSSQVTGSGNAQIGSNQGYTYNHKTKPALPDDHVTNVWQDQNSNLIYISTWGGLSVIDTRGTAQSEDDELKAEYTANNSPKIGSNYVYHSWLDHDTNLLYISTWGGLSVIDTRGTGDGRDDILLVNYNDKTDPKIGYNKVRYSFLDKTSGFLYICTDGGGLSVVDTKKTIDPVDDIIAYTYSKDSNPKLESNRVYHAILDDTGKLFVSTWGGGLSIINTQKTKDVSDDQLVAHFGDGNESNIHSNKIYSSKLDKNTNKLYVSTYGGGLQIIDLKNENDFIPLNDYSKQLNKILPLNIVSDVFIDETSKLIYISMNGGGVAVIDGASNEAEPAIVMLYDLYSQPRVNSDNIINTYVNSANIIFAGTESHGLSVVTPGKFNKKAVYVSRPINHTEINPVAIGWDQSSASGQSTSLQVRYGSDQAVWENNFDTNELPKVDNLWGGQFDNLNIEQSILKMNGREPSTGGASFLINASEEKNYFPAGSIVRAKIKVDTSDYNFSGVMFTDEWEDGTLYFRQINEWITLTLVASTDFSQIGFSMQWSQENWQKENGLQIDWLTIEQPVNGWSKWSELSSNSKYTATPFRNEADKWMQYRFNINSANDSNSPAISNIKFFTEYVDSGIYVSPVLDAKEVVHWKALSTKTRLPDGSGLDYFIRTGFDKDNIKSNEWQKIHPEEEITNADSRYIQYKVNLRSGNENYTPAITSLSVGYSKIVK